MDILSKEERSRRMSAVRSVGNRSTEWRFRAQLIRRGFSGWAMHDENLPGRPDFVFRQNRLVVFVDGCFWHGCPFCARRMPMANREYWLGKIRTNVARRQKVIRELRRRGFKTMQVWEHEMRSPKTVSNVFLRLLRRLNKES